MVLIFETSFNTIHMETNQTFDKKLILHYNRIFVQKVLVVQQKNVLFTFCSITNFIRFLTVILGKVALKKSIYWKSHKNYKRQMHRHSYSLSFLMWPYM